MTEKELKLAELRAREQRILAKGKSFACPGALKKVRRKIRKLENSIARWGDYYPLGNKEAEKLAEKLIERRRKAGL